MPPSQVAATDLHAPSPAALNPILRAPGSFVFAARAGLQVVGGGHVEGECSAEGSFSCPDSSFRNDTDESSPLMIGLDALIHAAPGLRLGAGYQWLPYAAVTPDDENEDVHLGHEHALHAVIEGIVPVSRNIALALRARGGLHILAVGGDLADRSESFLSDCRDSILARCKIDRGPLLGKGYGAMVGVVGGAGVRWRVDLAIERFSLSLPETKFELTDPELGGNVGSRTVSTTLYGTRSWILGGVEL